MKRTGKPTARTGLALFLLLICATVSGADPVKRLELAYVVKVPGTQTAVTRHPPYIWADEHTLIAPIQQRHEEEFDFPLQDVRLLSLDVETAAARYLTTFERVRNVELYQAKEQDRVVAAVVVDRVSDPESPGTRSKYSQHILDLSSMNVECVDRKTAISSIASVQPVDHQQYPELLHQLETNDLYEDPARSTGRGKSGTYDWARWGDFVVALGEPFHGQPDSDAVLSKLSHDLRLYDAEGRTRYIFPHVSMIPGNTTAIPTMLQTSPDGRYLMVSPQNFRARSGGGLDLEEMGFLLIYELTDANPSSPVETVRYTIEQDTGEEQSSGSSVEVERALVDGSAMSTGPIRSSVDP